MLKKISFVLGVSVFVTSCSDNSLGSALGASEFSQLFSSADSAFDSLGSVGFGGESVRFRSILNYSFVDSQSTLDPKCSQHGSPWDFENDFGGNTLPQNASIYSSRLFYCLATLGEGGPDTVRGSYATPQAVLCAVDSALGDVEYTSIGNTFTNVSVPVSTACFTQSMIEDMAPATSVELDTITFTELDPNTTGWQKKIDLTSSAAGIDYTLYYFKTADRYGFRSVEAGNGLGRGGSVSLMVDTANGDLVYSNIDDRGGPASVRGPDSLYRRIANISVNGNVAADGTFTTLENASGVFAQSGSASSYSDLDGQFSMATIKGNSTVGYKSYAYYVEDVDGAGNSSASVNSASTNCFDGNEDCTEELLVDSDSARNYYQATSSNASAWSSFIENAMPLCGGAVDIDSTPSTGPLGECTKN